MPWAAGRDNARLAQGSSRRQDTESVPEPGLELRRSRQEARQGIKITMPHSALHIVPHLTAPPGTPWAGFCVFCVFCVR